MSTSTRRRAASVSDSRSGQRSSGHVDLFRTVVSSIADSLTTGRDDGHHHSQSHKSAHHRSHSTSDDLYSLLQEAAYNLGNLVGDYETKLGVTPEDAEEHARKKERRRERRRREREGYVDDDGTSSRIEELPDDADSVASSERRKSNKSRDRSRERKHRHRRTRDKLEQKNEAFDKGYGPAGAAAATPKSPGWPYDTHDEDITITYGSDDSLYRFPTETAGRVPLHGDAEYDYGYDRAHDPRFIPDPLDHRYAHDTYLEDRYPRDSRRDSGFVDAASDPSREYFTGSPTHIPNAPYPTIPGEEPYSHDYEADNERLGVSPYIQPGAAEAERDRRRRHHRRHGTHRPGAPLRRISSNPEMHRRRGSEDPRASGTDLVEGNKFVNGPAQMDQYGRPQFSDPFHPGYSAEYYQPTDSQNSDSPSPAEKTKKSAIHPPKSREELKQTSKNFLRQLPGLIQRAAFIVELMEMKKQRDQSNSGMAKNYVAVILGLKVLKQLHKEYCVVKPMVEGHQKKVKERKRSVQ